MPEMMAVEDDATGKAPPEGRNAGAATIPDELVDQLLRGYSKPEDLLGPGGLIKQLMGRLVSRAMDTGLTHHLGYERVQEPAETPGHRRNGKGRKTVRTDGGRGEIEVPLDRRGTSERQIVGQARTALRRLRRQDHRRVRPGHVGWDIRAHLEEIYGVDVSPDLITRATDGVVEEMRAWQARTLEPVYLVVYLDALVLKIRGQGR